MADASGGELSYINGRWCAGTSGGEFTTRDPATGEALAVFAEASGEDIDEAVSAAAAAFATWRDVPPPQRGELLFRVATALEEVREELALTMTAEMGKPLRETYAEVDTAVSQGRYMAGEGRRAIGSVLPSNTHGRFIHTVRLPHGVVACISPWNYPVVLASYKIFAALVAGNTVVWKPAPNVSGSAAIYARAAAGLPDGVFNLVAGAGNEAGARLVEHPRVDAVAFTGSTATGIRIAETCARTLRPVSLELGGKNAVVVLEDADVQAAASGIVQSAFATSGQRCTAASRVIVDCTVHDDLLEELTARIAGLRLGPGVDPTTDVGPLATADQLRHVTAMVDGAVQRGARHLMKWQNNSEPDLSRGNYFPPTLLGDVDPDDPIAQDEVFGPVVTILKANGYDDAVRLNNATRYGLSSSVYTRSVRQAQRASSDLKSGLVYVNSGTSAAEPHVPFGGVKLSGNGYREVSAEALDFMTETKAIYIDGESTK